MQLTCEILFDNTDLATWNLDEASDNWPDEG